MHLLVYDDAIARTFAPFALTRPFGTVRAGAELIAERWRRAFNAHAPSCISSPHLCGAPEMIAAGTVVANSRCVVSLGARAANVNVWRVNGAVAAVRLTGSLDGAELAGGDLDIGALAPKVAREETLAGRWVDAPWDLIGTLPDVLADDVEVLANSLDGHGMSGIAAHLGSHRVAVAPGVVIEPHVVFDTSAGAIAILTDAHVCAFTRIAGPCVIGARTHIFGGRITGSAIGNDCRVHGDVSASVFVSHANKAHEGFVGHTVVGQWANLGAGTTTSNLKNSYGGVKMWTPGGDRETGLTFLGSLIGDHAKLGIGTMLGTGTIVGAGANVFGNMRPPKRVPPFAWGDAPPYETFTLAKFLDVAGRVMNRRDVALDDGQRAMLSAAHDLAQNGAW